MHRDTKAVEHLVGTDYALRMGDAPEQSVPRALWMESLQPQSPHPYKLESLEEHYHAARKLTDDLAIVTMLITQKATFLGRDRSGDFYIVDVWKKTGDDWQMIARRRIDPSIRVCGVCGRASGDVNSVTAHGSRFRHARPLAEPES